MVWGRALRVLFSSLNKSASRIGDFTSKVRLNNSAPGLGFFLHSCTSSREYCLSHSEGQILLMNPEAQEAVEIVYPSVGNVTLSGDFGEKNCYGIITDSDGTIVAFGGHLRSQSKEELSKIKVDVHMNPRVFGRRTHSEALSYADFVNNIAIINCDSDKPLLLARIGNFENLHIGDMVVFVSTANGQQRNRHVQFAAEWGTIIRCGQLLEMKGKIYVTPGSPTHRVGIRPGYCLNFLDGIHIHTFTEVGMPLTVTFTRRDNHIVASTVVARSARACLE